MALFPHWCPAMGREDRLARVPVPFPGPDPCPIRSKHAGEGYLSLPACLDL